MTQEQIELLGSLYKEYNPLYDKAVYQLSRLRNLFQNFYQEASKTDRVYEFGRVCFDCLGPSGCNGFLKGTIKGTTPDLSKVKIDFVGKTTEDYDYHDTCYLPVGLFIDDYDFLTYLSGKLEEVKLLQEKQKKEAQTKVEDDERILYYKLKAKFEPKTEGA